MFIENLTKEDILEFLNSVHLNKEYGFQSHISSRCEKEIQVYCENTRSNTDYGFYIRLEDFDADISRPNMWIDFMLNKFGSKYRKAYNKSVCI